MQRGTHALAPMILDNTRSWLGVLRRSQTLRCQGDEEGCEVKAKEEAVEEAQDAMDELKEENNGEDENEVE